MSEIDLINACPKRQMPNFIITRQIFSDHDTNHSVDDVCPVIGETTKFAFLADKYFNLFKYDYQTLYWKTRETDGEKWKYKKGKCFIKVKDGTGEYFYMHIKIDLIGKCATCDGATSDQCRILYSSDLDKLLHFIYTPVQLAEFTRKLHLESIAKDKLV